MLNSVMPWKRLSVFGLLPRRSVFETRLIYVGVLVDILIVVEGVFPK
jgi:hypothetical protein